MPWIMIVPTLVPHLITACGRGLAPWLDTLRPAWPWPGLAWHLCSMHLAAPLTLWWPGLPLAHSSCMVLWIQLRFAGRLVTAAVRATMHGGALRACCAVLTAFWDRRCTAGRRTRRTHAVYRSIRLLFDSLRWNHTSRTPLAHYAVRRHTRRTAPRTRHTPPATSCRLRCHAARRFTGHALRAHWRVCLCHLLPRLRAWFYRLNQYCCSYLGLDSCYLLLF